MISLPTMCLCKPTSGRLRPSRIVGTGVRMTGGGGACAVLADRMPLPWVRSSSPIGCLSLGCGPPRPSDASPLDAVLLAHRMPLPWVRSSSRTAQAPPPIIHTTPVPTDRRTFRFPIFVLYKSLRRPGAHHRMNIPIEPMWGRLRPPRIVGTGERMMGGGGACAVLVPYIPRSPCFGPTSYPSRRPYTYHPRIPPPNNPKTTPLQQ